MSNSLRTINKLLEEIDNLTRKIKAFVVWSEEEEAKIREEYIYNNNIDLVIIRLYVL